jgi:hypothetical protein
MDFLPRKESRMLLASLYGRNRAGVKSVMGKTALTESGEATII